jgi:hypothetical protein
LNTERKKLLLKWSADPWEFLQGWDVGPNGGPIYWTKDEGDSENPYKAFPDKPHLKQLVADFFGPELWTFVDKSRQMIVSTTACGCLLHHCLFRKGRKVMISKQKEDQAWMLIQDKIVGPYNRLPSWLKRTFPLEISRNKLRCARTDSMIFGVGQNAAASEFRGNQASILLIDEAAFQEQFGEMLRAAKPMAARVWAVTTANTGNPGAEKFDELRREE